MPEDGSNLIAMRPANSANALDLRRVGAHPDNWYPLAWSEDLKSGATLARRFAGEPIVLYRGRSGKVFALEDRCAHRQVPLSEGVVDGDQIACGYHGWKYDCSGKCVDVPYLGKERLPNGVKSYPAREVDGLIFFFPATRPWSPQGWPTPASPPRSAPAPARLTRHASSTARWPATTPSCTRTCST